MEWTNASWIHRPKKAAVGVDAVTITTEAGTDLWQRSYYGFRNDNAPGLLVEREDNFSLTVRAFFSYRVRFDQCGLLIYLDSDNWFKASIEYESKEVSRLGSVVTNQGYSDWATQDIATCSLIWYRLSRRGPDFLAESSADGTTFSQMRVFHLHALGDTNPDEAALDEPPTRERVVNVGIYACSPGQSSFEARFDHVSFEPCVWKAHR